MDTKIKKKMDEFMQGCELVKFELFDMVCKVKLDDWMSEQSNDRAIKGKRGIFMLSSSGAFLS